MTGQKVLIIYNSFRLKSCFFIFDSDVAMVPWNAISIDFHIVLIDNRGQR